MQNGMREYFLVSMLISGTNDGRDIKTKAKAVSTRADSRPSPTCNKNLIHTHVSK
jgi:hypothetical protein